jgi:hypothetical protein
MGFRKAEAESDNELDEPQESTFKKKLLTSAGDASCCSNQLCGHFNKSRIAGMLRTPKNCEGGPH